MDTVSPDVSLNISGANGENGWYVSPTTVTALGSDSTSGLASALLSADGGIWQPATTLGDGIHNLVVSASDNAGNVSSAATTLSVNMTTPSVNFTIDGTTGRNGWYRSSIQISALSSDATSGLRSFEVSTDGGGYQAYTSPVSFSDGHHAIRFKAVDNAGNTTEIPGQEFLVDTVAPDIELPVSWELGRNVPYSVSDTGSGLAALRIVIEDEDERYAKLAWDENVTGATYSQDIDWNGQFKDKTEAPPGVYLVWIKASDQAGNEAIKLGRVVVPEPSGLLALFSQEIPAETPIPPDDLSLEEIPSDLAVPPALDFGGSLTNTEETTTQSLLLTTGTAGSIPLASTNVLWGAAAAAAIGAATAYVLDERRKREEEIERQSREAVQELENEAKKREMKLQKQQENWLKQQALEQSETQQDLRYRDAALTASKAAKLERMEIEDSISWIKAQVENEERARAKNFQTKLDDYRATTWLKDQEAAPKPEPNWYDSGKAFIGEKIFQPLRNPRAGSLMDRLNKFESNETASLRQVLDQDAVQRAAERTKAFVASETADVKKFVDPALEKHRQFVASELAEIKKNVYEPLIQPVVHKIAKDISDDFKLLNRQVYQPYVQPLVASINEKVYQPYVRPVIERIDASIDRANDWVNRTVYYPVFAPVEEDIHEYIGLPASKWWKQYGEWVHGALDAAGFIPGFGDAADFINGVIYLAEGRILEATLSFVSGIPVIGYFGAPGKAILEAGQGAFDKVVKTTAESFGVNFAEMSEKQLLQEGTEKLVKEAGAPLITSELVEQGIQLAGSIPGAGTVTTSLTSLIQLGKGRTLDAITSAFSTVPVVGAVTTTIKQTIDESLQRIIWKQAREEAGEKLAKEITELASEKLARETEEVILEKAAKETGEGLITKSLEEAGEEITESVAKETLEEGAEHLSKEVAEASVEKTTKQTFEETAESAIERA